MILTYKGLIRDSLVEHTKQTLLNGEEFSYYIDKSEGWNVISTYPVIPYGTIQSNDIQIYNLGHSESDTLFIQDTFNKLDKIIDLDFIEMSHNNGSMLDIYTVNYSSSFEENTLGQAISQRSEYGSWWEILWIQSNLKGEINLNSDLNTIVHEIGHTLGLGHPLNDPFNSNWDTNDTVMSYNRGEDGWDEWFSELDINALISIWGREDDLGLINYTKSSYEYEYIRNSTNSYMLNTEIGLEDITNIDTLVFIDKSINVKEDIIGVFNLIESKDHITGKIFRLYNAALNRFPDRDGLEYWINNNTQGKDTYRTTATSFIHSQEFKMQYGINQSNEAFINSLYNNILGRLPDIEGFNYWSNQIEKGYETKSELLMGFSEAIENKLIFSNQTNIY
tara:strand:+ start:260 stop:1435 length:1176 start_codon:yes stop_codon:yes gene_type:complete